MTCLERLKLDHPDMSKERADYLVKYDCPSTFGYLNDPDGCEVSSTSYLCIDCWNREYGAIIDVGIGENPGEAGVDGEGFLNVCIED